MLRLAALLLASTLLVPLAVSAPTVKSYTTFTLEQFQSIADDVVAVPEIAAALPDGSVLTFVVSSNPATRYQGTVTGGKATMASGGSGTGDAQLTASPAFWGALVNACDRANTAKLGIRDGYIGIDGSAGAKAAANGLKTGRFDAQLAAQRPVADTPFPCQGYTPTLQPVDVSFGIADRRDDTNTLGSTRVLWGDLGGEAYIVNDLGAIEGQLPPVSHLNGLVALGLVFSASEAVSHGVKDVPTACKQAEKEDLGNYRAFLTAACMRLQGASS